MYIPNITNFTRPYGVSRMEKVIQRNLLQIKTNIQNMIDKELAQLQVAKTAAKAR